MDEMRCVLYAHGGMNLRLVFPIILKVETKVAITSEVWTRRGPSSQSYDPMLRRLTCLFVLRYSIQRYARKIRGRVLGE